jgi:hypothetical protein
LPLSHHLNLALAPSATTHQQPLFASPVSFFSKKLVVNEDSLKERALQQQRTLEESLTQRCHDAISKLPTPQESAQAAERETDRIAAYLKKNRSRFEMIML